MQSRLLQLRIDRCIETAPTPCSTIKMLQIGKCRSALTGNWNEFDGILRHCSLRYGYNWHMKWQLGKWFKWRRLAFVIWIAPFRPQFTLDPRTFPIHYTSHWHSIRLAALLRSTDSIPLELYHIRYWANDMQFRNSQVKLYWQQASG